MQSVERPCVVCGTVAHHVAFIVREMFFGSREEFSYFECAECSTIQIAAIPSDLARHYPSNYYSYAATVKPTHSRELALRRVRTDAWLRQKTGMLGRALVTLSRRTPEYLGWFRNLGISTESRILDVGCGGGQFLLKLQRDGFIHLRGIDPFLSNGIDHGETLAIANIGFENERGMYDLIMFHHSFEHMTSPATVLQFARSRLTPGGHILIRTPVAGCYAWRKYRQHWYSLDAPRHLFIPTVYGMNVLARQAGLKVRRIFFDSDSGQIVASEKYVRDIPLVVQMQSGDAEMTADRQQALNEFVRTLNHAGDGDSAGFILDRDGN